MNVKKRIERVMFVFYKVLFECDQELIPKEDNRKLIERCSQDISHISATISNRGKKVNEYLSLTNDEKWQKHINLHQKKK